MKGFLSYFCPKNGFVNGFSDDFTFFSTFCSGFLNANGLGNGFPFKNEFLILYIYLSLFSGFSDFDWEESIDFFESYFLYVVKFSYFLFVVKFSYFDIKLCYFGFYYSKT